MPYLGIETHFTGNGDILLNFLLPLVLNTGVTMARVADTFKRSMEKTWGTLRVGGCFLLTFPKMSSIPACGNCEDANGLW